MNETKINLTDESGRNINPVLGAGWIKIEDQMPKKMDFVLFCELTQDSFTGNLQTFHLGWFDNINMWFSESTGWIENKTKITHWMPLPSPPACT